MAKERDTGARGLRCIVEEIMIDVMFELPDHRAQGQVRRHRGRRVPEALAVRHHQDARARQAARETERVTPHKIAL